MTKSSLRIIVIAIAAIVTVCSAISDDQQKKITEYARTCVTETGANKDDVNKIIGGDFSVTDKKVECFAKCFFEKIGFMNAAGEFLDDVAIEKLSRNGDRTKVEALINTCKLQMGTDPCETAYKIYQCYVQHKAF